jgi:hypothetical protein
VKSVASPVLFNFKNKYPRTVLSRVSSNGPVTPEVELSTPRRAPAVAGVSGLCAPLVPLFAQARLSTSSSTSTSTSTSSSSSTSTSTSLSTFQCFYLLEDGQGSVSIGPRLAVNAPFFLISGISSQRYPIEKLGALEGEGGQTTGHRRRRRSSAIIARAALTTGQCPGEGAITLLQRFPFGFIRIKTCAQKSGAGAEIK